MTRLAGIGGFMAAFDAYQPDLDVLRRFDRPVFFALGGRGNPDLYPRMAARMAARVAARVAAPLRDLWTRAESITRSFYG